jgi:hypothetical protein
MPDFIKIRSVILEMEHDERLADGQMAIHDFPIVHLVCALCADIA